MLKGKIVDWFAKFETIQPITTWDEVQWIFISRFSEVWSEGQVIVALHYAKQKKYELIKDYYDRFLRLCVVIPQWHDDIYLKETFKEGLRTKMKMAIIGVSRRTLTEVAKSVIAIEK